MIRAPRCVIWVASCALLAGAATRSPSTLTVVMDFQGSRSERALAAMERETEGILSAAGMRLDWRFPAEAARENFEDLVVVRFKGACKVEPMPALGGESGPMAFTYSRDGEAQPFAQVFCANVAASVRSAMWAGGFQNADVLFGRALGRVLAHELVHVLTHSVEHGREGVLRPALSARELISGSLPLSAADVARLQQVRGSSPVR